MAVTNPGGWIGMVRKELLKSYEYVINLDFIIQICMFFDFEPGKTPFAAGQLTGAYLFPESVGSARPSRFIGSQISAPAEKSAISPAADYY